MKLSRAVVFVTAALILPSTAFAACEEKDGLICGSGTPQVSSEAGLQVSRGGSFSPLASGTGLRGGDRVLTGEAPASVVLGPSCKTVVGPGALVSITRNGGRTCASVTESTAQGPVTGDPSVVAAAAVAAGAAGAVGLGLALSGDDRNPPPPPNVSAQ